MLRWQDQRWFKTRDCEEEYMRKAPRTHTWDALQNVPPPQASADTVSLLFSPGFPRKIHQSPFFYLPSLSYFFSSFFPCFVSSSASHSACCYPSHLAAREQPTWEQSEKQQKNNNPRKLLLFPLFCVFLSKPLCLLLPVPSSRPRAAHLRAVKKAAKK